MKTTNRISTAAFLAAASLAFSPAAWSLGLGDVNVESYLNQPLQLRIDLITRETDDLAAVTAQLGSVDDYELIGASRDDIPVPIRFTVEDIEGTPYLLGTSNLPIGNPVVRLIVQLNYASGRLLREYTVFLDPPTQAAQAPIPRVDLRKDPPPAAAPAPVAAPSETAPAAEPAAATEASAGQAAPAASSQRVPSADEYGPVSSGETLWAIAKNWSQGTGLELNQVMIAIQRQNPEAFLRGNINLLKRGAILRMPRAEDVRNISTAAAINEVAEQTEQFREPTVSETVASPSTPLLAEEAAAYEPAEEEAPESPSPDLADEEAAQAEEVLEAEVEAEAEVEPEVGVEPEVEQESEQAAAELTDATEEVLVDQLELVPPSAESDLDSAYGFEESGEELADASVATASLRENLARTEEELITQQQQNEYLEERIRELEAQLEESEQNTVADADLASMEQRLREQRAAQASSPPAEQPWYSQFSTWLIGLLVLAAAFAGWLLSRRGGTAEAVSVPAEEEARLREIKDEAEEVLRVLEDPEVSEADQDEVAAAADQEADEEAEEEASAKESKAEASRADVDDAEVLDEESSDPEIQLDLARAYISMGDKEAARVILEEVKINGNEFQREEAIKMLDLLVS
jgi:pilus assembly protein FimV